MKRTSLPVATGLLVGAAFLLLLPGCYTNGPVRSTGYQGRASGHSEVAVTYEDDYDYYPGYEIYYSRNRHEYVYRNGNAWVRRPQPGGVSLDVLLASPAVRVDFRDAPELHHDTVVRTYPKNWKSPENKGEVKQEKKDQKDDEKDQRKDDHR
jgi:hypothetical protein